MLVFANNHSYDVVRLGGMDGIVQVSRSNGRLQVVGVKHRQLDALGRASIIYT